MRKNSKLSEEHKKKISITLKSKPRGTVGRQKGFNHSEETRKKMKKSHPSGKNHWNWKGGSYSRGEYKKVDGRKEKRYFHLYDKNYKEWRIKVFLRDNWICQTCGDRSKSGIPIYLEAHHIKSYAKFPELRLDVSNGITLCKDCHKLAHKFRPKE